MSDKERIKKFFSDERLTHVWMIFRLHLEGIEVTKSEFSTYLNSEKRDGSKADTVIEAANRIIDIYERTFTKDFARTITG